VKDPIGILICAAISGFLVSLVCAVLHALGYLTGIPVWLLWLPAFIIPSVFLLISFILLVALAALFLFAKPDPES
jgi:hypothetical protein